jgi:hypothetical protein
VLAHDGPPFHSPAASTPHRGPKALRYPPDGGFAYVEDAPMILRGAAFKQRILSSAVRSRPYRDLTFPLERLKQQAMNIR